MSLTRRLFVDVATASRLDLDPGTIRELERRFNDAARSDRRIVATIAVGAVVLIAAGFAIGTGLLWFGRTLGVPRSVAIPLAATVTPITLVVTWFTVFPRLARRTIRRTLRDCGYDVCIRCGYLLEGLERSARCPECGRAGQPPLGEARDSGPE